MNIKKEIKEVEKLGNKIGYGWMMTLASALWRKDLKDNGYPESGAFIVKGSYDANEEDKKKMASDDQIIKDNI